MRRSSTCRIRRFGAVLFAVVVLSVTAQVDAGEINLSKYIEPNQMSNLLTRHVRKGIIKRIGLSDDQLRRIVKTIDPHRETLLAQITDFKDARIETVYAVGAQPFDPERVTKAHAKSASAELILSLSVGAVIQDVRPILTEAQLEEVMEMIDEVRAASEVRFADFAESLAAGNLLGIDDKASKSRR